MEPIGTKGSKCMSTHGTPVPKKASGTVLATTQQAPRRQSCLLCQAPVRVKSSSVEVTAGSKFNLSVASPSCLVVLRNSALQPRHHRCFPMPKMSLTPHHNSSSASKRPGKFDSGRSIVARGWQSVRVSVARRRQERCRADARAFVCRLFAHRRA